MHDPSDVERSGAWSFPQPPPSFAQQHLSPRKPYPPLFPLLRKPYPPVPWPGVEQEHGLPMDAVRAAVNDVAERALVGRRIFDTVAASGALPVSLAWVERTTEPTSGPDLRAYEAQVRGTPAMLWTEFAIDPSELAEAPTGYARFADLTKKIRRLAAAEDEVVFRAVTATSTRHTASAVTPDALPAAALGGFFSAATEIRQAGHYGEIALVAGVAHVPDTDKTKPPHIVDVIACLAKAGTLRNAQQFFSGGVFVAKLPAGLAGLVVAITSADVRIIVAQNYEVSWLGAEGPSPRFGVSVSLSVHVGDGTAVRGVDLALEGG